MDLHSRLWLYSFPRREQTHQIDTATRTAAPQILSIHGMARWRTGAQGGLFLSLSPLCYDVMTTAFVK